MSLINDTSGLNLGVYSLTFLPGPLKGLLGCHPIKEKNFCCLGFIPHAPVHNFRLHENENKCENTISCLWRITLVRLRPFFAFSSVFAWRGVEILFKPAAYILISFSPWINLPLWDGFFLLLWFILNQAEIIPTDSLSRHLQRAEITTTFAVYIVRFQVCAAGEGKTYSMQIIWGCFNIQL